MLATKRQDQKHIKRGDASVNKDELIIIAQEGFLLEFEAEMRAASHELHPRPTKTADVVHYPKVIPRLPRSMGDRLQQPRNIKDCQKARVAKPLVASTRECHLCRQVGHIARNSTNKPAGANGGTITGSRLDPLAARKTDGHTSETCNKPRHTIAQ